MEYTENRSTGAAARLVASIWRLSRPPEDYKGTSIEPDITAQRGQTDGVAADRSARVSGAQQP